MMFIFVRTEDGEITAFLPVYTETVNTHLMNSNTISGIDDGQL